MTAPKVVRALDHLEAQAQHNLANLATWEPVEHKLVYTKMVARCARDAFLRLLLAGIRSAAEAKMHDGGVDVDAMRARVVVPPDGNGAAGPETPG